MTKEIESEVIEGEVVEVDKDVFEVTDDTDQPEIIELLNKDAAEQLTRDIQSTTTALYVLLKRAHDTKAWLSLGYKTWSEYISEEFDFSRARSYQLINQANVIEEITEASGVPLYITEKDARSIKKRLPEITEKLKDMKDEDLSEEEVKEFIEEEGKEGIDNSDDTDGEEGKNDGGGFDSYDDEDDEEDYEKSSSKSKPLSDDEKFRFENLLVTLEIFETMPNASEFGKTIKYSNEDKKRLIKLAESSFSWITQLLDELE